MMTKKILIIDDDTDLQEVFPLMFEGRNYQLRAALNIENIEEIIIDFKPDIILLDIWIDQVDGRVVCNYLKSHENTAQIPIILISGVLIDIDDVNCRPEAIIQKPFEIAEIIELIEELALTA